MMQERLGMEESLRKVNISPTQVALIVDQYLCANNLSHTRATFRMEASSLFACSSFHQPSLNLEHVLDDYIFLKRKSLILNQERVAIMQEKYRVEKLVQEVQNVVDAYRSFQRLIPINIPVTNKTPSGLCTVTTSSVQNTNTYNKIHWQQSNKRKNSEAIDASTIAKKPRGRPPGKKNQVKGLNVLPPLGTQSLIVNSTATGSQVPTTSSIIETQPGTATNKSVTTCNKDVVTHCEAVMVCPEEEITNKLSLRPSLISSDSGTEDKRELDCNASHVFLENSIPNGFSTAETEKERIFAEDIAENSQLDLLHIKLSDLDMEYWSNFSLKDTGIFAEDYFDCSALTQVDA